MHDIGKLLVILGLVLVAVGVVVMLAGRLPWLGRLPGDIHVERGHWSFYFPLATSLVLSVVISLVLYLIGRR
jgi:membrane protein implicated in regulation of membrane protease activity